MSKPHKKLVAWQKSMELVERLYSIGYLDLPRFSEAEALVDECLAITFGLRKSIR